MKIWYYFLGDIAKYKNKFGIIMTLWIDADSCPLKVREVVCRASLRLQIQLIFVANIQIPFPEHEFTQMVVVEEGEGVADDYITEKAAAGDLAITRDIPLAARLIENGVHVINDRGDEFTPEMIRERLSIRDLMYEFRQMGVQTEKHSSFSLKELQKFSSTFDRVLTRILRNR